jgi:hypothetical protein
MSEFQTTIPLEVPVEQTLKDTLAVAALMHLHVKSMKETSIELGSVFGVGDNSAVWEITVAPAPAGSTVYLKLHRAGPCETWLTQVGDQFRGMLEAMVQSGPPPDGPPPPIAPAEDPVAEAPPQG